LIGVALAVVCLLAKLTRSRPAEYPNRTMMMMRFSVFLLA
jgi:hypothetical protein